MAGARSAQAGVFILIVVIAAAVAGLLVINLQKGSVHPTGEAKKLGGSGSLCCLCRYEGFKLNPDGSLGQSTGIYAFENGQQCPPEQNGAGCTCPASTDANTAFVGRLNFLTPNPNDIFPFDALIRADPSASCLGAQPCEDQFHPAAH